MLSEDRSILSRESSAPPVVVSYGDHPDQVAEIFPAAPEAPLVIVLHGGFWQQRYDRSHCRGLAVELATMGATVVLLEYRRVGGGGGWPATFDDVRLGLRKVVQHHPRSARRIVVGHSAGGHLGLWAASTEPTPVVDAVIGLAAVADLTAMARSFGGGENPVHDLLGGTPENYPDRYDLADPCALPTPRADVRLLHGVSDTLVPIEQSLSYAARHPGTQVSELRCAHFELIDPRSDAFAAVREAVQAQMDAAKSPTRRSRPW
ncbi:MAG: alpha/beta hydrolase [Actinomycetes bacterium]